MGIPGISKPDSKGDSKELQDAQKMSAPADAHAAVFAASEAPDARIYPKISGDASFLRDLKTAENEAEKSGDNQVHGGGKNGGTGEKGSIELNEDKEVSARAVLNSLASCGFQASRLGEAAATIEEMLHWRLAHESVDPNDLDPNDPNHDNLDSGEIEASRDPMSVSSFSWGSERVRRRCRARIFLSFTSNLMSSGLREHFVFLAKHKLVDVIVTSAGGVEEDFVKCLTDFHLGSFSDVSGAELRKKGWNRIGNIYAPNQGYERFEDWLMPLLDSCYEEQKKGYNWTASKLIRKMGEKINDENSLFYWCWKNDIEVFCPGPTDGSLGDILFFHAVRLQSKFHESHRELCVSSPGLRLDVVEDVMRINLLAMHSRKTGIICLGGGSPKHHTLNANLMRNGADFSVYVNTAQEFDGSDSGASPDEAVSWGKLRAKGGVKVCVDATIAFPLLVATVFREEARRRRNHEAHTTFILQHPIHDL